jgi:hypothetical protein
LAGSKSEERVEVEVKGFRARSTCLGLQVVQRADFDGGMKSLDIWNLSPSSRSLTVVT